MGITSVIICGPRAWAMSRKVTTWFIQLGNSIGVLVVSLLLGQQHSALTPMRLILALCCLFSASGRSRTELFFHFFSRWEKLPNLALVMVGSALVIALGLGKLLAGILA